MSCAHNSDETLAIPAVRGTHPSQLDRCFTKALELLSVMDEEADALKSFESARLLEVLIRKEALAKEVALYVERFRSATDPDADETSYSGPAAAPDHLCPVPPKADQLIREKRTQLKQILAAIDHQNRHHLIYIQTSLAYWQDLLSLFMPGIYIANPEGQARLQSLGMKGYAFNKEI